MFRHGLTINNSCINSSDYEANALPQLAFLLRLDAKKSMVTFIIEDLRTHTFIYAKTQ